MENEIIKKKSSLAMPASILAAGFLIALAVLYTNGSSKENTPSDSSGSATVDASKILRQRDSDVVLGNPEAPVTVVEYSDFQCPFCGRFFHTTLSEFKENYIKTGQAKFIYRDFAFLGQESIDAAAAAKCAGDQGKFWDYHDYLFSHQSGENQGNFSVGNLKKFAGELKLNGDEFSACLDGKKYEDAVKQNTTEGVSLGVTGTPTIFINGEKLVGAQPFSALKSLIDAKLK